MYEIISNDFVSSFEEEYFKEKLHDILCSIKKYNNERSNEVNSFIEVKFNNDQKDFINRLISNDQQMINLFVENLYTHYSIVDVYIRSIDNLMKKYNNLRTRYGND